MKVEVGQEIALNNCPDAAWFRVTAVDGFFIELREVKKVGSFTFVQGRRQVSDASLVKQIRNAGE